MKLTLLDLTQSILSSLNSDQVNSIGDTPESMQVAEIIKVTYFNILSRSGLVSTESLFQLDSSTELTQPVLMYKPENVDRIEWIKYNDTLNNGGFKYVTILPITQFLEYVDTFNVLESDVYSFTLGLGNEVFNINYKNSTQPRFCTVFQNTYVVFDSYDASQDDTLQSSKTRCLGYTSPTFFMKDTFIPDLDENLFPLLLNEAKSLAFFELKQSAHPKAEQESRRQWGSLQRIKSVTNKPTYFEQLPDFGRRGQYNTSYFKSRGWDPI